MGEPGSGAEAAPGPVVAERGDGRLRADLTEGSRPRCDEVRCPEMADGPSTDLTATTPAAPKITTLSTASEPSPRDGVLRCNGDFPLVTARMLSNRADKEASPIEPGPLDRAGDLPLPEQTAPRAPRGKLQVREFGDMGVQSPDSLGQGADTLGDARFRCVEIDGPALV